MKPTFLTILIIIELLLLTGILGGGCASIASLSPWGSSEPEKDDDPVATAAMQFRRPTSIRNEEDEERYWNRRNRPASESIEPGMEMDEVAAVWGEPTHIETAGDPRDGNQRWVYYSGLSSRYGLGNKRIVYFENGQVAGWKKAP